MHTLDNATQAQIVGRLVGDLGEHVAVAVVPDTVQNNRAGSALTGHLLAVRQDGAQYAVWAYSAYPGPGISGARDVNVYWGTYFDVFHYPSAYDAFQAANLALAESVVR
jgi:hypothetical protein